MPQKLGTEGIPYLKKVPPRFLSRTMDLFRQKLRNHFLSALACVKKGLPL